MILDVFESTYFWAGVNGDCLSRGSRSKCIKIVLDSHLDPIYGYFMAILYAMIMGKSDD